MRKTTLAGATLAIAAVFVTTIVLLPRDRGVEAASLSERDAVGLAIQYAQRPAPAGWLDSAPTQANAKLMTFRAAWQLKDGRPLQPSTKLGQDSNRPVWLVFLPGDVIVQSPPVPGRAPASRQTYHQVSVVLDANTGELLSIGLHPPTHEVADAATLPTVALPVGTPAIAPPAVVKPTEAPLPTRVPPTGPSVEPSGHTGGEPGSTAACPRYEAERAAVFESVG